MPKSRRFSQLEQRLNVLREHFIPATFSETGSYEDRTLDHTRAFVVLAHAEMESYIEDRARSKAERALKQWRSSGLCSGILSHLLVYHSARTAKGQGWTPAMPSDENVRKAVSFYVSELGQNHGIKEHNVLSMLVPIGLAHRSISTTLLATLDSFGVLRGRVAHMSLKAHQAIDPKTSSDNVLVNILPDLVRLDESISRLR
jgi:hypothetical protein